MKAIERLLDRPLPIYMAALLFAVLGLWSAFQLPIKRNPQVEMPYVLVVVPYEGASAGEVEAEVTIELEEELNALDRLRHMNSRSAEGVSTHILNFEDRTDMMESLQAVRDKVDLAEVEFPGEADDAVVRELSFDDIPILFFAVSGGDDLYLLRDIASDLRPELESVPGVSRVDIFGGFEREVHILVDPPLLAEYGLTMEDVIATVRHQSGAAPAGKLRAERGDLPLRPTGEYSDLAQIRTTIVTTDRERPVALRDLARVELSHRRLETGSWFKEDPSVTLIVRRRTEANTLETARLLHQAVEEYRGTLPHGIEIHATSSTVPIIRSMVRQLSLSAILGMVLVVAVLWVMFGWRQALLVSCVLPFSLLFVFSGLHLFGMEISNIALFAMILVLGLVVDGAIIIGESIFRERECGHSPSVSARKGLARVGIPVISADLTTVAAFVPMLMMVGVMGQFMAVMPKVVIFALMGSVFADHLFLPAIASKVDLRRGTRRLPTAPDGLPWFSPELPRVRRLYLRHLGYGLRHRGVVAGAAALAFSAALALLVCGVVPSIFLPDTDHGRLWVNYELPPGSSLNETGIVGRQIAREIGELPEVESFVITTGDTGALNVDIREDGRVGPEYGKITVELLPTADRRRSQGEIAEFLRSKLAHYAGVELDVEEFQEAPPVGAALTLRLSGPDLEELEQSARRVQALVRKLSGARDVRVDYNRSQPEIRVELDRSRAAALYGITPNQLAQTLLATFEGVEVGRMWVRNERVDIRLLADHSYPQTIEYVAELTLRAKTDELIPIGEVASVRPALVENSIFRYDARRTVTVMADAASGASSLDLEAAAHEALQGLALPSTVRLSFGGESEERDRSYASLWGALKWGLLLIFVVMAIQFNSIRQPLIVLMTIPLSICGVIAGLLATGTPFSFMVFIGIVALTGIVVNDGIVMIDAINQNRKEGMPIQNAIRDAAMRRMRPVLLTTITTALGLLPLTLNLAGGGEFWVPIGITIISGLVVASALTLHVVPVLYSLLEGGGWRWQSQRIPLVTPDSVVPGGEYD